MTFRKEMWQDKQLRIVDFCGHVLFALVLPGHWWYQFLPELVGPFLFVHGFFSNRILSRTHPLIRIQNLLHTIYIPIGLLLSSLFVPMHDIHIWKLVLQYTVHIIWDQFTHEVHWQKRSLWHI